MYEPVEDLVGDAKQGRWDDSFSGPLHASLGLGIVATSALPQTFGILRRRRQEERKSHNQDFSAAPAGVIRSEQIESVLEAFPGFRCLRAAANS